MSWLNYHHLLYFRMIAREGGISAAARKLRITHSTLSAQLRQLESVLGGELFRRERRRLVLTPFGEQVLTYGDSIHRLGTQLLDFAHGRASPDHREPYRIGVADSLPKTIATRLVEPLLAGAEWGPVEIREQSIAEMVGELVSGRIRLGLVNEPVVHPQVHAHFLGRSGLAWYGSAEAAPKYRRQFPRSLRGAPFVLPTEAMVLRRALDRWLSEHVEVFRVAAEVNDAAMLRILGARGTGVFPVRAILRSEVHAAQPVREVGPIDGVFESYFLLSVERTLRDPSVLPLVTAARTWLERARSPG